MDGRWIGGGLASGLGTEKTEKYKRITKEAGMRKGTTEAGMRKGTTVRGEIPTAKKTEIQYGEE